MHHLLLHTYQDMKRRKKTKIRTQHLMEMNTGAKEITQLNPNGIGLHNESTTLEPPLMTDSSRSHCGA